MCVWGVVCVCVCVFELACLIFRTFLSIKMMKKIEAARRYLSWVEFSSIFPGGDMTLAAPAAASQAARLWTVHSSFRLVENDFSFVFFSITFVQVFNYFFGFAVLFIGRNWKTLWKFCETKISLIPSKVHMWFKIS